MKQIPVDECPAGRGIDLAVEEVSGRIACDQWIFELHPQGYIKNCYHDACYPINYPPQYSRNIEAAWGLIYQMGIRYAPSIYQIAQWYCNFLVDGERIESCAITAPLAITRAFLKAKGIKFVEVPDETNTG